MGGVITAGNSPRPVLYWSESLTPGPQGDSDQSRGGGDEECNECELGNVYLHARAPMPAQLRPGSNLACLLVSLQAASSAKPGHSAMKPPAGKKDQPKQENKYLARAAAAPATPSSDVASPARTPPTWAPSPQSAAKAIAACDHDAVEIDFDDGDGLPQRGETALEETSASPPAREPPAALPVAADQAPSTASEKRPRADDDDEERKRP